MSNQHNITAHNDAADEHAARLLADAIVWDNVWPLERSAGNGYDKLDAFAAAGWTHVSLTIAGDRHNISEAVARVAAARRRILARPEDLILVEGIEDVRRAKQTGRLAVSLHFEGTRCFERNLDMVEAFHRLGIKHTLLAFNNPNEAGGGCAEEDMGLTRWGRKLIAEMERVGMVLDLSHTGYRTSMDALAVATCPALFSHSNADTVAPHWRNLRDDQIVACAATGGMIGLSGSSGYLGDGGASTESMFRHIDYIANLVGIDHIGLGLDVVFDEAALNAYVRSKPDEWPGTSDPGWPGFRYVSLHQLGELIGILLRHGYSDGDIIKILGGNYMRLYGAAWAGSYQERNAI